MNMYSELNQLLKHDLFNLFIFELIWIIHQLIFVFKSLCV